MSRKNNHRNSMTSRSNVSSKPVNLWVSDTPVTVLLESITDTPDGRLTWNFIVSDPRSEYDGKRVRLFTSESLAKQSRARRYVEILLNRACFPGEDVHEDSLIGQAAAIYQGDLIGEIHDEVDIRVMPYQSYLKTEHWQQVRDAALERAEHRCQLCNTDEHLHVHHRTYENRGAERDSDVIVLCKACHERFHGVTNGKVTHTVR